MMRATTPIAFAVALLALSAQVFAQVSVPGFGYFHNMRQQMSTRAAVRASQHMDRNRGTGSPQRTPPQLSRPSAPADTTFQPQASELAPALMAGQGGYSRAERQRMQAQLSEYLTAYRQKLRAAGGPQNDVARAAAYLASATHEAYFGTAPVADATFQALRQQFEQEFAVSAEFQRKSDRERQIEFEVYAILGTMVTMMRLNLEERPEATGQAQMKRLARESFVSLMGAPPEQVRLTPSGYEIDRR